MTEPQERPSTLSGWPLDDEDRMRVAAQVDRFIEVLSARYGVQPGEIVEAVRWVREHRAYLDRVRNASTIALIGALVSASALALWEGIKAMFRREFG